MGTLLIRGFLVVALLLTFVFPARAQDGKGIGVVTAITGQADLKRPQAPQAQALKLRDNLFVRDVVDTHKESLTRILLLGKSTVTVREFSRFEIREETRPDGSQLALINLVEGRIRVMVAPRLMKPGDAVEIRTPNAIAGVRGSDGILEVLTLPDGRPQTSLLVASGKFEITTPSTRPIALAETVSDAPSGIWLAQAPGVQLVGVLEKVIVTGPSGLQQVSRLLVTLQEIQAELRLFRGASVASGTSAKSGPVPPALERALEAAAQAQTLTAGEQPGPTPGTAGASIPTSESTPTPVVSSDSTSTDSTSTTTSSSPPPSSPSPSTTTGDFDKLSPGEKRIVQALFAAQKTEVFTRDDIAAMKLSGLGWGDIIEQMRSVMKDGYENLGRVVSQEVHSGGSSSVNGIIKGLSSVTLGQGLGRGQSQGCLHGQGKKSGC